MHQPFSIVICKNSNLYTEDTMMPPDMSTAIPIGSTCTKHLRELQLR